MIFRAFALIGLFFLSIFITPLLTMPLALWYAVRWYSPEIIVIGFLLDVYFGTGNILPYYTLGSFLIVFVAESAKSFLMLK